MLLFLLSLIFINDGETHDRFFERCSSQCMIKFDENLLCWNRTAQFFDKTLLSILFRYVTTQLSFPVNILTATKQYYGKLPTSDEIAKQSVDRMVKHMEHYYLDRNAGVLTRKIINKTIMALVSSSFKTIEIAKQLPRPLLTCPRGCERSSKYWLSWSFISLLFSGLLTFIIIIKKLEQDRVDQNFVSVEKAIETTKGKKN
ncbi:ATP synthase subunit [Dirofilaria immitis]